MMSETVLAFPVRRGGPIDEADPGARAANHADRLAIRPFRLLAYDRQGARRVRREAAGFLSPGAAASLVEGLDGLIAAMAGHMRRRLTLAPPCQPGLTADERSLVGLVRAAAGDPARLQAHLCWLIRQPGHAPVAAAAVALAPTLLAFSEGTGLACSAGMSPSGGCDHAAHPSRSVRP